MGLTKTNLFTPEQNELAQLAKCMGHPARIAILQYLLRANACINTDLVNELGLAQATISQHLKELKSADLIKGTIDGVSMNYCINTVKWKLVKNIFVDLFDQHPCCGEGESCC